MKKNHLLIAFIGIINSMSAQNVGIGTSSPSAKLEVIGDLKITNATYGLNHTDGTTRIGTYVDAAAGWFGTFSNHPLWFFTNDNSTPSMVVDITGDVGIGTSTPDAKLQVQGQVKIVDGSQGANKVLTSDADGLATWQPGPISQFAMFYGLTSGIGNGGPTDYAATIPTKTAPGTGRVPFPRDGPAAGITRVDASSFTLPGIGTFEISFSVQTTESGQLQLELNGVDLAETLAANLNPAFGGHPIIGHFLITTTLVNSVLAVINPSGNVLALTVTPADGANTHANSQRITIKQIF